MFKQITQIYDAFFKNQLLKQNEIIHDLKQANDIFKQQKYDSLEKTTRLNIVFLISEISSFAVFSTIIEEAKKRKMNPIIVITPHYNVSQKWQKDHYSSIKSYFQQNNIEYKEGIKTLSSTGEIECVLGLEELHPHFVFYPRPYLFGYHRQHQYTYVSHFTHVCYIPYGFGLLQPSSALYNQLIHDIAWKIYCETEYNKESYAKAGKKRENIVVTGYPRFDLMEKAQMGSALQRIKKQYKKVIVIALHWSVRDISTMVRSATFPDFFSFLFTLPKQFQDCYFIFRPHPNLRYALHETGILHKEAFDILIETEWNCHKNALYCCGPEFFDDYFYQSDGLITDCLSFLAEYLLTQQPILYLDRPDRFLLNDLGEKIIDSLYKAKKAKDISRFVNAILLSNNDPLKEKRMRCCPLIRPAQKKSPAQIILEDLMSVVNEKSPLLTSSLT